VNGYNECCRLCENSSSRSMQCFRDRRGPGRESFCAALGNRLRGLRVRLERVIGGDDDVSGG